MASQNLKPLFEKGERVQGMFFDPQTDIVYFLKSIGNKKVKFSTRVKTNQVRKAKNIANQKLQDLLGTRKAKITSLVKDETKKWFMVKESEGLDPKTIRKISEAILRIDGFWGQMYPSDINRDNIAKWFLWHEMTYPGQQKFNAIKYMNNFCKYLGEKGLLTCIPKISDPDAKKIKAQRVAKKGRIFTTAEFKKVYVAGNEIQRHVALFMYTMATRIEETLSLRYGIEISHTNSQLSYTWAFGQNKADLTGRHLLHPLLPPMIVKLNRKRGEYLFPQLRDPGKPLSPQQLDWDGWRKRANLGWHWTSHTFRHTCLSNLFNDARNPQALICKLYRVSLPVALNVYVKPTIEGIEQMRNAIEVSL